MLIAIISGWILFLVGNETMIKEEHNETTFEPTTLGWMLNIYGMGLFVFGVLVLHRWCETNLEEETRKREITLVCSKAYSCISDIPSAVWGFGESMYDHISGI